VISTDAGGHVFAEEKIAFPSSARVTFRLETSRTSETLAVDVRPVDPPAAQPEPQSKPAKRRGEKKES
jgi:hypothetical protein